MSRQRAYVCCHGSYELGVYFESSDIDLVLHWLETHQQRDFFFPQFVTIFADQSQHLQERGRRQAKDDTIVCFVPKRGKLLSLTTSVASMITTICVLLLHHNKRQLSQYFFQITPIFYSHLNLHLIQQQRALFFPFQLVNDTNNSTSTGTTINGNSSDHSNNNDISFNECNKCKYTKIDR
ncbi:hypothetical protein RFI_25007 [Reticulomyxa filosa]|uniref:Uncharacterized protein n=1 Tax=Reticulomyxa filosa TaxID=46433 RepID=X6MET1_RETFI|nr:hypothetical protein RFI_25007 [Reticulomyxa filosa]|eukprot:ETO12369.1 hypothetical protein RFI_25007 [Reticulomyxa filosa]